MNKNQSAIIKVSNLTKKYNGLTAVDNISFEVKKGGIFALLGPNGAGKSTTIKILTTLLHPTSGQIKINGFDPLTQQDQVRKSFGIVFQDPSLDDQLTTYENMDLHGVLYHLPKDLRRQRVKELLLMFGLWQRKDSLVNKFSFGMKRRLEMARGLLHHPTIFFLDEPTLGLDTQTRNQMWQYLLKLNKKEKTTIFFTTHYLEEAEKTAQTIAIINHGKIIEQGTVRGIIEKTKTNSLEQAFLKLTGYEIREEETTLTDRMKRHGWRHH